MRNEMASLSAFNLERVFLCTSRLSFLNLFSLFSLTHSSAKTVFHASMKRRNYYNARSIKLTKPFTHSTVVLSIMPFSDEWQMTEIFSNKLTFQFNRIQVLFLLVSLIFAHKSYVYTLFNTLSFLKPRESDFEIEGLI